MVSYMILNISHSSSLLFLFLTVHFIFGITATQPVSAQLVLTEEEVRIGKISVQGNIKTKQDVIIRELEFTSGDLVSQEMLEAARKRIENLNLFNRVIFNFRDAGELRSEISNCPKLL